jgi:bleomycin hydrolase
MAKITESLAKQLSTEFLSCPKNRLAMNVCTKHGPVPAVTSRAELEGVYHVFNHKVDEVKPVTNQKMSGRCWIFSLLNVMRVPFCKQLKLEDFEFSQSYLFFWDKVERSNFFLHNVVEAFRKGETPSGRLVSFFLHEPASDAGQWDMLVNLVNKYGVVPKKVFPEAMPCEDTDRQLNRPLYAKLREYARELYELLEKGLLRFFCRHSQLGLGFSFLMKTKLYSMNDLASFNEALFRTFFPLHFFQFPKRSLSLKRYKNEVYL